jgi:hypothetical protein
MKYRKYEEYHRLVNDVEQKQCQDCGNWFDMNLENFGLVTKNSDGFNHRCKVCQKIHNKSSYNKYKNGESGTNGKPYIPRKGFNEYIVKDDCAVIYIKNQKGETYESYIDIDDLDKLIKLNYSWHLFWSTTTKSYYVKTTERYVEESGRKYSRTIYLHRYLLNAPEELYIDHLNHNTLDNRKSNLKIVTNIENHENRRFRPNINSSTGVKNVTYAKREKKYIVQFWVNGSNLRIGKFDNLEDAKKLAEENYQKYCKNAM